jgi:hypothetical protein
LKVRNQMFIFLAGYAVLLVGLLIAGSNRGSQQMPTPSPALTSESWFNAGQTIIPAGGCVTLTWQVKGSEQVILNGSNWPEGLQEVVQPSGSSVACPSAALNYVPDEPVRYRLIVTYPNDRTETREIIISYENPTASPVGFVPSEGDVISLIPDTTIDAVFQPFESGWIIWRGDINTSFVLLNTAVMMGYTPANVIVAADGGMTSTLSPDGIPPHPKFFDLWQYGWLSKSLLSGLLGMPANEGIAYQARVFNQSEYTFEMLLPDGTSTLYLTFNEPWLNSILPSGHWSVTGIQPTFSPTLTPYPTVTPSPIPATYQAFERGFMVLNDSFDCVYAFMNKTGDQPGSIIIPPDAGEPGLSHQYYYCLEAAELPDNPVDAVPPEGLLIPTGSIGKVWGAYDEIRTVLGYATDEPVHYARSLPRYPPTVGGGPWSSPVIPLPEGTTLWCGFRAATAHSCYVE